MILARQHQPGGYKTVIDPYEPKCEWPADCTVQWGSHGIVLSRSGPSYETAFFEAFPTDPRTFIRGEGANLEEAESKAFAHLTRVLACPSHFFERGSYRNGAGICKHCRLFASKVFEPLEVCTECGKPTFYHVHEGKWYCETHAGL